ncbi:PadR family transcriptional regulator [Radiobacillus kanasensis]|uniref:PadR family transcriptional regulator n=1 Tax=Radiobacillus kanasensis TaxID=2844358 RepID=UPI001E5E8556|nr:PadR family transcriptional regulator [Radiobacillus kanasensis]UFT98414.1 PadR family transcriptional regulator [Radiobacillus kanasensis]
MEERLKRLKEAMHGTAFKDLHFSEQHMDSVRGRIKKEEKDEKDILVAILQILVEEKTGHELAKQLSSRGIKNFEGEEGFLYTILHRIEQKGYVVSNWDENEVKRYIIHSKGKRLLSKLESSSTKNKLSMKLWLEVSS